MEALPLPPSVEDLAQIVPLIHTLKAGERIARIYFRGGDHPGGWEDFRYWGPTASRFDHQDPSFPLLEDMPTTHGIIYGAAGEEAIGTCLAEVFQQTRIINLDDKLPALVIFELGEDVHLLDITGTHATKIGASAAALSAGSRKVARGWSRNIHAAYPGVDGIYYGSSMFGNHPAVAIYERAELAIPLKPTVHRMLSDPLIFDYIEDAAIRIAYEICRGGQSYSTSL